MRILKQVAADAQFTMGMDASGREFLSLVVKSTFDFPSSPSDLPVASREQRALVMADEFEGEPGFSAVTQETDFAFRKGKCDVVAQGAAYAPGGTPATRVRVGLRVGNMVKQLDVTGAREWRVFGPSIAPSDPYPFTRMAFSYGTAFGGVDRTDPDLELPPAYDPNPVGLGFAATHDWAKIAGLPVANTEEADVPIRTPFENYRPMSLGPVGRAWPLRRQYTGTYDQDWIDNVFPFLPKDFDERYFQCAPEDQQIAPPAPGTEVVIVGMTPAGKEAFRLPDTRLPLRIFRGRETAFDDTVLPDTLFFDTEARVFTLTWRVDVPIRREILEFTDAWVGAPTEAMIRAHREGRTYIRDVATEPSMEEDA